MHKGERPLPYGQGSLPFQHDPSTDLCNEESEDLAEHRLSRAAASPVRERRAFLIRVLTLLCTCSLSVGSH